MPCPGARAAWTARAPRPGRAAASRRGTPPPSATRESVPCGAGERPDAISSPPSPLEWFATDYPRTARLPHRPFGITRAHGSHDSPRSDDAGARDAGHHRHMRTYRASSVRVAALAALAVAVLAALLLIFAFFTSPLGVV